MNSHSSVMNRLLTNNYSSNITLTSFCQRFFTKLYSEVILAAARMNGLVRLTHAAAGYNLAIQND